jgi:allophanate hydrolase subunit 2
VYPGCHYEGFEALERDRFTAHCWCISSQSDRSGYRLQGCSIEGPPDGASEPVLPGCVQIPGNGAPIVTLQDGPTVGGYPVIALLQARDIARFAQCPPKSEIKFEWIRSS